MGGWKHLIDDDLWALIEPNHPLQKPKTGRLRADLRKTFSGILYWALKVVVEGIEYITTRRSGS